MLYRFLFDSVPQSASPYTHGTLLWIDDRIAEIAREVDYKPVLGRGGTSWTMSSAANCDLEIIRPGILQRKGNVVSVLDESHDTGTALSVDSPSGYRRFVISIVRGHNVPLERLLECGDVRHPGQGDDMASGHQTKLYIAVATRKLASLRTQRAEKRRIHSLGVQTNYS